ncbi:hypothetical protein VitviT2T_016480 [Vitis vinifera]|uniref:Exostosin GT47 domain-containing protein n=3 Tax=Vitis vinifera TaxID=29760 RepID=A0ABY9CUU3_VITVI|eukprot:XP_002280595.2 PREDICTED: probable glycosyltransferase At5g03795 [Vitis vinifera]
MDMTALFMKLCHVESRRLLFIVGLVVASVIVFQVFELPSMNTLTLSPTVKGSVSMMVGDATILKNSISANSYVIRTVVNNSDASDLEDEADMDYHLASDDDGDLDYSVEMHKEKNSDNEFILEKGVGLDKSMTVRNVRHTDNSPKEKAIEFRHGPLEHLKISDNNFKIDDDRKASTSLTIGEGSNRDGLVSLPLVSPGISSKGTRNLDADSRTSDLSTVSNVKHVMEAEKDKNTNLLQTVSVPLDNNYTIADISITRRRGMKPTTISKMNLLLLQSAVSSYSMRPRWSSPRDRELLSARSEIQNAPVIRNTPGLYASVYRNVSMFKRSYELMERVLKIYIYREGEKPIFHQPRLRGIYASEGWFMKLIEGNKRFVVRDPRKAHLFYVPFSSKMLRTVFYEQNSSTPRDLEKYFKNYVGLIAGKYRFWNRTGGADHLIVACHDWAPRITRQCSWNSIRALCNSNIASGFKIGKDTTLPVTYIRKSEDPLKYLGGKPPSQRPILAFFAGSMHGYLRPILLQYWENKEQDIKIFGPMSRDDGGKSRYRDHMKSSKYCICARGYEVHTPRVVEAIFYECVPVIISDNYVPPFFEILNWEAFAVFILEKDVPNLRNILLSIPEEKYLQMQMRVKMVQQHFLWHKKPVKYDLFHMILHSVWYNRVFQVKPK